MNFIEFRNYVLKKEDVADTTATIRRQTNVVDTTKVRNSGGAFNG